MTKILFTPNNLNITAVKKSFGCDNYGKSTFKGAIDGEVTIEYCRMRQDKINEIRSDLPPDYDQSDIDSRMMDEDYLNEEQVRKVAEQFGLSARVVATLMSLYGRVCGMGIEGWQLIMFDEVEFAHQLRKKYGDKHCEASMRDFPEAFVKDDVFGFNQNVRQSTAMCIDHELSLLSVRSGMFQTPMSIFRSLGYESVDHMRMAHCSKEENQLRDFLKDLLKTDDIKDSLKRMDWTQFARLIKTDIHPRVFANTYLELHAFDWVDDKSASLIG